MQDTHTHRLTHTYTPSLVVDALVARLKSLVADLALQQGRAPDPDFLNAPLRCLVIGLGESGLAMLDCLKQSSPDRLILSVFDTRDNPPALAQLQQEPRINYINTTQINQLVGTDFDVVLMSPGLSTERGDVADWLIESRLRGVMAFGEMDLFSMALEVLREQQAYQPKVIGITGSNGKTTVTTMTQHVLNHLGVSAVAAGNISPAAMAALFNALHGLQTQAVQALPQVWVLELSSFQLSLSRFLRLDAGVLLNLSEDHLDWHVSMQSYHHAKQNVYRCADVVVLNADDPYYQPERLKSNLLGVNLEFLKNKRSIYFGLSAPSAWQHWGLIDVLTETDSSVRYLACQQGDSIESIVPVNGLKIRGLHNMSNALAVLALCDAIGVKASKDKLIEAVSSYRGQPHRVEWVNQVNGVDFFDDSKGTNIGATQAALMGLAGEEFALFVIVGGDGKGQDFTPLAADLLRYTQAVFLIGRDAPAIEAAVKKSLADQQPNQTICMIKSSELTQAVSQAFDAALGFKLKHPTQKVAVLLSPACASLDQFKNYAHRAQVFCDQVNALAVWDNKAI